MKKLAIGCGIAALVIAAIGIGATIFGVRWVKSQMADAKRYERIAGEMESAYGAPESFLPPPDGQYDAERVAVFARVRRQILSNGSDFVASAQEMAHQGDQRWWKEIRGAMQILNAGAGYLATADSLLLEAEMGHGEYSHYQVLLLREFLDESPRRFFEEDPSAVDPTEFAEAFEAMADEYEDESRRLLQSHARNAREAAEDEGPGCVPCLEWIAYLDDQLERTRNRRAHLALTEPLPPSLEAAFENHRTEFEATRPHDFGTWLLAILMVLELDDDGDGLRIEFGE